MVQEVLSILFPNACCICGEILHRTENGICKDCKGAFVLVQAPTCKHCGKPVKEVWQEFCFDCSTHRGEYLKRGFALWEYNSVAKKAMMNYKYAGYQEIAGYFAGEIIKNLGVELRKLEIQAIVPVPLYDGKLRYRGFNQAELIAREIAKRLEVPCYTEWLVRVKNTKPQNALDDKERFENLKDAFVFKEERLFCQKILLIDDIYTTGTTINECAKQLRMWGALEVYSLCVFIGKDF